MSTHDPRGDLLFEVHDERDDQGSDRPLVPGSFVDLSTYNIQPDTVDFETLNSPKSDDAPKFSWGIDYQGQKSQGCSVHKASDTALVIQCLLFTTDGQAIAVNAAGEADSF